MKKEKRQKKTKLLCGAGLAAPARPLVGGGWGYDHMTLVGGGWGYDTRRHFNDLQVSGKWRRVGDMTPQKMISWRNYHGINYGYYYYCYCYCYC